MSKYTLYICDRCGSSSEKPEFTSTWLTDGMADLCSTCSEGLHVLKQRLDIEYFDKIKSYMNDGKTILYTDKD